MDRRKRLLQAAKDRIALRANPFVLALTAALVFGIFLTRPFISPGLSISMLYAIPVALVGFWSSSSESKLVLITAATCTGLIFANLILDPTDIHPNDFLNRGIAVVTLWSIAAVSLMRKRMVREVKALRGLLSICSYCKKVRDSQDTWTSLEAFVTRHSEADFSHGVCPNCLTKHFPETAASNPPSHHPLRAYSRSIS
jgi:hypothetical protein